MGESVKKMKGQLGSLRPINASFTSCAVILECSNGLSGLMCPEAGTNNVGVFVPCDCFDHTRNRYLGVITRSTSPSNSCYWRRADYEKLPAVGGFAKVARARCNYKSGC